MRDYTEDENGHIARVDFDFVIDDQQLCHEYSVHTGISSRPAVPPTHAWQEEISGAADCRNDSSTSNISNHHIDLSDFFICCVVVSRRSHRYASFLRLAYEKIILRQYSRYLIFDVLDTNIQ